MQLRFFLKKNIYTSNIYPIRYVAYFPCFFHFDGLIPCKNSRLFSIDWYNLLY